nr:hypothetical protein [Tanacetum cinerariifolium]
MQTQTSNTLHNAIMEAGSKDRPPMLAPGNYIQWKSRIKRYIDTKPNRELIHYYLENPPYKLGLNDKSVLDSEGNPTTATERVFETSNGWEGLCIASLDQVDSVARTSRTSGVKHLIPSRLTRYLNLSSDKALVNRPANWYSVSTKNNSTIPFSTFFYEVISDIDVLGMGMLDSIARDGYGFL